MSEDPLTNPEEIRYTDGSSFVLDGKRRAGYAVVSNFETIEAKPLPPGTSAQLAELIALIQALELGKRKKKKQPFTLGGSDGKASVYNAGDLGSSPGLGRSPGEGNGNPLQYHCLENPMDRGAW